MRISSPSDPFQLSFSTGLMNNHVPYNTTENGALDNLLNYTGSDGHFLFSVDKNGILSVFGITESYPSLWLSNELNACLEKAVGGGPATVQNVCCTTIWDASLKGPDSFHLWVALQAQGKSYVACFPALSLNLSGNQIFGDGGSILISEVASQYGSIIQVEAPQVSCYNDTQEDFYFPVFAVMKTSTTLYPLMMTKMGEAYENNALSDSWEQTGNLSCDYQGRLRIACRPPESNEVPDTSQAIWGYYNLHFVSDQQLACSALTDSKGIDPYLYVAEGVTVSYAPFVVTQYLDPGSEYWEGNYKMPTELYAFGEKLILYTNGPASIPGPDIKPENPFHTVMGQPLCDLPMTDEVVTQSDGMLSGTNGDDPQNLYLWYVTNSGNLYLLHAPWAQRTQAQAWTVSLPLLSNAKFAAGGLSPDTGNFELFVLLDTSDTQLNFARLSQDNKTGHWHTTFLSEPVPGETREIESYTTKLQLNDNEGLPISDQVQLGASSTSRVMIDGTPYTLGPDNMVSITPDPSGQIAIAQEIASLCVAYYTLSYQGFTFQVPTNNAMRATLQSYSDTNSLTELAQKAGKQPSQSQLQQTSAALAVGEKVPVNADGSLATPSSVGIMEDTITLPADSLFSEIGDLFQYLEHVVESAVQAEIHVIEDAWHFVVTLEEQIISAEMKFVEDLIRCLQTIFRAIEMAYEDLYKLLSFLFEWGDITTLAGYLEQIYGAVFSGLANGMQNIQTDLAGKTSTYKDKLAKNKPFARLSSSRNLKGSSDQSATKGNDQVKPVNGCDVGTDPKIGWAGQHLKSSAAARNDSSDREWLILPPSTADSSDSGVFSDFISKLESQLSGDLGTFFDNAESDTAQFFSKGGPSTGAFLEEIADDAAILILDAALDLMEDGATVAEQCWNDLTDPTSGLLYAQADIPVLSALFSYIDDGKKPSVMTISCLFQAAVLYIAYGVATGKKLTDEWDSASVNALASRLSGFLSDPLSASTGRHPTAPGEGDEVLETATKCLALFQFFMVLVSDIVEVADEGEDNNAFTEFMFFMKGVISVLMTGFEAIIVSDQQEKGGDELTKAVFELFFSVLYLVLGASATKEDKEALETITSAQEVTNTVFGVWGIVDDIADHDSFPIGDFLGNLGEVCEFGMFLGTKYKFKPNTKGYIVGVKSILTLSSDIIALLSTSETSEKIS